MRLAKSLAPKIENASRLAAMQRAEKNIDECMEGLNRAFHRVRQSSIDEELFDLVSGFAALANGENPPSDDSGLGQTNGDWQLP